MRQRSRARERHDLIADVPRVALAACGAALLGTSLRAELPTAPAGGLVQLIVQEAVPATSAAESAVLALGGRVEAPLSIVGGFVADVPSTSLPELRRDASVKNA